MNEPCAQLRGICKVFGDKPVLTSIDAEVRPGDVIGLLGANGAGKTTLIEIVLGLSPASFGDVRVFGSPSISLPATAKSRIGFVPQEDELIDVLNGRQYLELIASFFPRWDETLAQRLVAEWNIDLSKNIGRWSPGERQKLAIVSALAHEPDFLVLDEPVSHLDPLARRQFLKQIVDTCADGSRAVLFSSHIVSDVERLASVIWILRRGQLVWQGGLDTLKESAIRVHLSRSSAASVRAKLRRIVVEREAADGLVFFALREPDEDWSRLEESATPDVHFEHLSLEEIFIELHA